MTKAAPTVSDYLEETDEIEEDVFEAEDETEVPVRSSMVQRGWQAAKKIAAQSSGYANELKLSEGTKLVKFLGDGSPLVMYSQHFVSELEGKKSHLCRLDIDDQCPFCDAGIRTDHKYTWAVSVLTDEEPVVSVLTTGPKLYEILLACNAGRSGPLSNGYWEIQRHGSGLKTSYLVSAINNLTANDLADPAKFDALVAALDFEPMVAKITRYTEASAMRDALATLS